LTYSHRITQLTGITSARLAEPEGLSAVAIAAAAAVGMSPYGPPVVRSGPKGTVTCLLCHGGHVIAHVVPEQSLCIVDILAMAPGDPERGVDVIAKRLNGQKQQ
jgi:S-adenosylmethionine/arginine decarboxylase-like enzyme